MVRDVPDGLGLLGERIHQRRVAVAEHVHRHSAEERIGGTTRLSCRDPQYADRGDEVEGPRGALSTDSRLTTYCLFI